MTQSVLIGQMTQSVMIGLVNSSLIGQMAQSVEIGLLYVCWKPLLLIAYTLDRQGPNSKFPYLESRSYFQ